MDRDLLIKKVIEQVDKIQDRFKDTKQLQNKYSDETLQKFYNLFLHINLIIQYDSFSCFEYEEIIDNFKKTIINKANN